MQSYHLTDEFTDIEAEQAILASLMQSPGLYWDLLDLLTPEAFSQEASTWQALIPLRLNAYAKCGIV